MPKRLITLCSLLLLALPATATTVYKYRDGNGVVTYTDKAVRGARVFVFQDRMVERIEPLVRLETSRGPGGDTLWLHNEHHAPVEVELRLEALANVRDAPAAPLRRVLAPRSRTSILSLAREQADRPPRYTPRLRMALGDPRPQPAQYRYPLPWHGGPFRLSQGANGRYSHFTPKSRYALDIAMPEGTPIVAARGGVVVKTENAQHGRGNNPAGNFVRILHDDGTMGVYLHLAPGSVGVREGQRVAAGKPLARSGNTGNSTGPHLHFVVQRNTGLALQSIPFEFAQPVDSIPRLAVGGD